MFGIPYSLVYLIPFAFLLFLYPIAGVRRSISSKRIFVFCIIILIFIFHSGIAYFKINNFKLNEYKDRLNSEYSICLNWKNQMEIIKNRCLFSHNETCEKDFYGLKASFGIREKKISLYENPDLIGIQKLPELHDKLKNCAGEIGNLELNDKEENK